MGKDYGLFASEGTRVFVRSGIIKITIDYEGNIIYKDLRQNLYARTDWQNKKVTLPSLRELKELHLQLFSEDFKATKSELIAFEKKLTQTIRYLVKNKTSNIIVKQGDKTLHRPYFQAFQQFTK